MHSHSEDDAVRGESSSAGESAEVVDARAASVERIWRAFHAKLRSFLLSRVRDTQTADDILQDVFVKVHRNVETLRDEERLAPWLFRITRNAMADYYRGRDEHTTVDLSALGDVTDDTSPAAAEQGLAAGLFEMIDELPPHYREAIRLTEIEGLTQAAMAQRLGISISGAKSRVQRAREKLKELLLDCCHVEFDCLGGVAYYERRDPCCRGRAAKPSGA